MTISTTQLASDMDYMIADLPSTLVWGAQTISGTRSEVTKENRTEDEGDYLDYDLEWAGKIASFSSSTLPTDQTVVTVDSVKYYIERIVPDQAGVAVSFFLRRVE